jgi:hypothetical protein
MPKQDCGFVRSPNTSKQRDHLYSLPPQNAVRSSFYVLRPLALANLHKFVLACLFYTSNQLIASSTAVCHGPGHVLRRAENRIVACYNF